MPLEFGKEYLDATLKEWATKEKYKLDFIKIKTSVLQRTPSREWKDNIQSGRKCLQFMYLENYTVVLCSGQILNGATCPYLGNRFLKRL